MQTVIVMSADTLGRGSDELGSTLMANFLRKLWAASEKPAAILFYNSGVRLLAEDARALDALAGLAHAGVDLVACGTCVSFFGLVDALRAGRVGDMQEIVQIMLAADKVVTV
jgi:selenium metabolism protein YedF